MDEESIRYTHFIIPALQETRVISTAEMPLTRELHIIRAHHLHYSSLIDDFQKHVLFIRDTHNPAMETATAEDRRHSKDTMHRECENLLTEAKRLKNELHMQERRLKNVMNLVCHVKAALWYVTPGGV